MYNIKLVNDEVNARVIVVGDTDVAFYTDKFTTNSFDVNNAFYCEDHVIPKVIEMFNEENRALTTIDDYLLDESGCSQEVRETIVEGLFLIFKKYIW
jgi:hypothetical protein